MSIGEIVKWIDENYSNLQERYAGKYISVKDKEIIATGDSLEEVVHKTKFILNKNEHFHIEFIERGDLHTFSFRISSKTS